MALCPLALAIAFSYNAVFSHFTLSDASKDWRTNTRTPTWTPFVHTLLPELFWISRLILLLTTPRHILRLEHIFRLCCSPSTASSTSAKRPYYFTPPYLFFSNLHGTHPQLAPGHSSQLATRLVLYVHLCATITARINDISYL